tara:strand:- start:748 stop:924 length:177 start_codon:yes stop_codon:yes gene_type:complete
MERNKVTTLGRDYFLEALPIEWDEKLDGKRPSEKKKEKGDVIVSSSELQLLKNLGLLK